MMFDKDLFGDTLQPEKHGSILAVEWDYPPFSVLNAREGWWQERKRAWLSMGIRSELGRGEGDSACSGGSPMPGIGPSKDYKPGEGKYGRTFGQDLMRGEGAEKYRDASGEPIDPEGAAAGTSIFDPTLTELCYRWFCPPGGRIVDPFAGGSVRGVVASVLGYSYEGCELRDGQVAANIQQLDICREPMPTWVCDDSANIASHFTPGADFLFSCPPYADLEIYSDDPRDLSQMDYCEFLRSYRGIIAASCGLLANDRFACFVVGDVRDKKGNYRNFVGDTVEAFRAAGLHYYNEAILVTSVGSLPIRVGKQFKSGRKLGKTHQNILVFVKGCGKAAAKAINCGLAHAG
jgi:hypothetical protein